MRRNHAGEYRWRSQQIPSRAASVLVRKFFAALAEKRITIAQAANDANVNRVTVSYWKAGKHAPDLILIEHLCRLYDIRITIP